MTTFLLIVAGVCALSGGVFWMLWRREKRKRLSAEMQRDNAVARAEANAVLVRELQDAAAEADAATAEVEKEREKHRKHIEAMRKRLQKIGNGEDLADEWNNALGHE
jgi:uncharacterized protein HemX